MPIPAFRSKLKGKPYLQKRVINGHIETVVAFLVVDIFSCLIITSEGVGVMTWECGELFSYVSSTFLYLPGPEIQAVDASFVSPEVFEKK